MFGLGTSELLIILAVLLLLFGGAKLPKLARSLGQASNEFKKGVAEAAKEESSPPAPPVSPSATDSPGGSVAP